jgi:hypothetical protein
MKIVYKLTDEFLKTHIGRQWILNEWQNPSWDEELYCYSDPILAILLNPIHANIAKPHLFRAETDGGCIRLIEELPLPVITLNQCIHFIILCSLDTYNNVCWQKWATDWLSGADRLEDSARAAWKMLELLEEADVAAKVAKAAAKESESATWAVQASAWVVAWAEAIERMKMDTVEVTGEAEAAEAAKAVSEWAVKASMKVAKKAKVLVAEVVAALLEKKCCNLVTNIELVFRS